MHFIKKATSIFISPIFGIVIFGMVSCAEKPIDSRFFRIEIPISESYDSGNVLLSNFLGESIMLPLSFEEDGLAFAEHINGNSEAYDVEVLLYKNIAEEGWQTYVTEISKATFQNLNSNKTHVMGTPKEDLGVWKSYHQFVQERISLLLNITEHYCHLELKILDISNVPVYLFYQECYYDTNSAELLDCAFIECVGCWPIDLDIFGLAFYPIYDLVNHPNTKTDRLLYALYDDGTEVYLGYY